MREEGEAGAEKEGGDQEDTEVEAGRGGVGVGQKLRDILLHTRGTHLDLVAFPHLCGRRNGISRKL